MVHFGIRHSLSFQAVLSDCLHPLQSVQVGSKFKKSEHSAHVLHSLQQITFSGVAQQREANTELVTDLSACDPDK